MPTPEACDALEAPDDVVSANDAEEKHIEGQRGRSDVTVPKNETSEQSRLRRVCRVMQIAIAVNQGSAAAALGARRGDPVVLRAR